MHQKKWFIGAAFTAVLATGVWLSLGKDGMDRNQTCQVMSADEWSAFMTDREGIVQPEARNPVAVNFHLDPGFEVPQGSVLEIGLGTAPMPETITPEFNYSVEYLGPFRNELHIAVSRKTAAQPQVQVLPTFILITSARRAVCSWYGDRSITIEASDKPIEIGVELLDHRITDGNGLPAAYRLSRL
ncbi:hypothetical protein JMK10_15260 [Rhodovulum sulfidophilum]|uniref:hypothetical protein n=1 Tax=Rhodovulum sulfidophilum TaxID=35806 RepID=UPI001924B1F6|nr:hypothetical protein [Rhodovulum sulfidophilum]MBL3574909.1 hypothetical protein [Rhodovulum sulfidophilum]MCE8431062.1 hypothetical protein [Rhodovulum sulfidophilum]MCF4118139.1 hypothetical protein [Rhodovulum sulfidophilum]